VADDEFAQFKVATPTTPADEFAQYKAPPIQPDTIGVNRGAAPVGSPGYQYSTGYQGPNDAPRDSGGFIDRLTTQAGRALQNPGNFLPSWKDIIAPGLSATQQSYQEAKDYLSGAPAEDPAKKLGNMVPAAISALVTHAADAVGNPMAAKVPAEVAARAPQFTFQVRPEDIPKMANRASSSRAVGQPADTPQAPSQYEVQRIPAGVKPTKASMIDPYKNQTLPPMTKATSGTVEAYHYDPATQTQIIHFKSGDIYQMKGVPPEVHQQFVEHPSMGSFHADNIKGRYETTRIGKVAPTRTRVSQALSQNQPYNMNDPAARAASDAAFQRNNPPEDIPENWGLDLSGGQESTGPDLGAKVRSKMPPLPRGGTK
jgi:hypothetical protein